MEIKLQPGGFFKLKISLENLPYPCTRKILVPWNINMEQLHYVIQIAMGWEMAHLYQFTDKKGRDKTISLVQEIMDDLDFSSNDEKKASEHQLKNEFSDKREASPFWYWYDFGDDWWHRITFLKSNKNDLKLFKGAPLCVEGQGSCPPEDVGGPYGFTEFLNLMKGPNSAEKREMKEWMGMSSREQFDEDLVEIEEINEELDEFYNSPEWEEGLSFEDF